MKKTVSRKFGQFGLVALAILSGTLSVGCGRLSSDGRIRAPSSSWKPSPSAVTTSEYSDYNCPSSTNVAPDYDQEHDGSGYYKVCTSQTRISDILIRGKTSQESTICVFPAHYVSTTQVYLQPDPQTGAVWSICADVSAVAPIFTFENITYNSVFIVEGSHRAQMTQCLSQGNSFLCPSYSFGKFR